LRRCRQGARPILTILAAGLVLAIGFLVLRRRPSLHDGWQRDSLGEWAQVQHETVMRRGPSLNPSTWRDRHEPPASS
jgi:hypothetical protein